MRTWKKTLGLSAAWLIASIWGSSASAVLSSSTTVTIDDSTETLTLSVNGVPIPGTCFLFPSFEQCTDPLNAVGAFPGSVTGFNILEPGTGAFSDFIEVLVGLDPVAITPVDIVFRSALDGVPCTIATCGGSQFPSVTEAQGFQTVLDVTDANGNELVVKYVSDVETTVPEPATLALLGVGLAGLGFSRRRKRS